MHAHAKRKPGGKDKVSTGQHCTARNVEMKVRYGEDGEGEREEGTEKRKERATQGKREGSKPTRGAERTRTSLLRVKRPLYMRQQIRRPPARALRVRHKVRLLRGEPRVPQRLRRRRTRRRVDRQALAHEVACGFGDVRPVFLYGGWGRGGRVKGEVGG